MLHLFQVNTGTRISLSADVQPTERVEVLCRSLDDVDKSTNNSILMTAEGKLMVLGQTIASYSAGTEQKPIYVFSKWRLDQPTPPQPSWPTVLSTDNPVEKDIEDLLRKSPSPSNFQKQALLAKQLAEYGGLVCNHGKGLAEEYSLQFGGLQAAIANSKGIIMECRKHHNMFATSVSGYISVISNYKNLLDKFRETVGLLQLLPFPSFAHGPGMNPSTLHEWIMTQDEESSLDALEAECVKAIKQVEEEKLQQALSESETILADQDYLISIEPCNITDRVMALLKTIQENYALLCRLAENIQITSQKALRNGDGMTIADLTTSHHMSLQMMQKQSKEMWSCVIQLREIRQQLTKQVHDKLKSIAQMQMKLTANNGCLVFWHECIKLAKRRFEVLQQIQCVPEVLGSVIAEVERRRIYRASFLEHAKRVSKHFKAARDTERNQRRAFREKYHHHFILTLFPSLSDRPPEFAITIPENFDEQLTLLTEDDLVALKKHLPSTLQACIPVVLLQSQNDQETQTNGFDPCVGQPPPQELDQVSVPADMNKQTEAERVGVQKQQYDLLAQERLVLALQLQEEQKQNMLLNQELEKGIQDIATLKLKLESERQDWNNQLQQIRCERDSLRREVDEGILTKDHLTKENDFLNSQIKQISTEKDTLDRHILQVKQEKEVLSMGIKQWGQKEDELNTTIQQLQRSNQALSNDNEQLKQHGEKLEKVVFQIGNEKELISSQLTKMEHDTVEKIESLTAQNVTLSRSLACIQMEREVWADEQERTRKEIEKLKIENDALSAHNSHCIKQNNILAREIEALIKELEAMKLTLQQNLLEDARQEGNELLKQELDLLKGSLQQTRDQLESKTRSTSELQESHTKVICELRDAQDAVCKLNSEFVQVKSQLEVVESSLCAEKDQVCQLKAELGSISVRSEELQQQLKSCLDEKLHLQNELSEMMDSKMKESMELERELRELRRSTESISTSPQRPRASCGPITISNLQTGDQAMFIVDPNNNYLALTLDGNTYYLHHSCTGILQEDIASRMSDPLKRCAYNSGILIGTVTKKQLLEVKKESNRLRMPVGSRLYQVYAQRFTDTLP